MINPIYFITIFNIICFSIKIILAPVFLDNFSKELNPYFMILFSIFSIFFILFIIDIIYSSLLSQKIKTRFFIRHLILISISDTMGTFLIIYTLPTSRLPATMPPVLNALAIPTVYFFRNFNENLKKPNYKQLLFLVILIFGAFLYIIPYFIHSQTNINNLTYAWCMLYMFGIICWSISYSMVEIALKNRVIDEEILYEYYRGSCNKYICNHFLEDDFIDNSKKDISEMLPQIIKFEKWRFFSNSILACLFSFVDIIPSYGTSSNTQEIWIHIYEGLSCFFTNKDCNGIWYIGVMYVVASILFLIISDILTWRHEANLSIITTVISIPIVLSIFIAFPNLTEETTDRSFFTFAIGSVILMSTGTTGYIYFDEKQENIEILPILADSYLY